MITQLEIEGFKSFGSPGVRLKLGAVNFVVGPNASGKTNLLSALRFLQNAVTQNLEYAVNDLGGTIEVRNKILRQRTEPKPVRLRVKIETETSFEYPSHQRWRVKSFDYQVTLDLRSQENLPEVDAEQLRVSLEHKGETQVFRLTRDKSKVVIADPLAHPKTPQEIPVPRQEATRLALAVGFFAVPCVILRDLISRWRFFHVSPAVAREPCKEIPDVDLGPSGENLAVILHKIEQAGPHANGQPGHINAIINGLQSVVPGFKGIKTTQLPVESKWAFQVLEEKIKGAINPASVSDGTIRLLTLLVITQWTARRSPLIGIEEPENGVHPHLSEHVVDIIRSAAEDRQFLITTHNPAFLDYLRPEEVVLCDKEADSPNFDMLPTLLRSNPSKNGFVWENYGCKAPSAAFRNDRSGSGRTVGPGLLEQGTGETLSSAARAIRCPQHAEPATAYPRGSKPARVISRCSL